MSVTDIFSLLLIALSLSADCFAVVLGSCLSMTRVRYIQMLRTALAFGLAQTIMPLIGWLVGSRIIAYVSGYDHWVAFGLLAVIGGRMLWEAWHEKEGPGEGADISRGWLLVTLALATSIDALAVGLSFAFVPTNIVLNILVIGVVAFLITILGFYIGRRAGGLLGQRAKIVGGLILIGIGVRILLSHLLVSSF
jgi:putative Mn2+ efflux pump MntP